MKDWWGVAACKHVARKIHDLIAPIALDTHERLKNYMLVMPYEYIDNLDRYSAILRDVKPPVHAGDGDAFAGYFQGVPTVMSEHVSHPALYKRVDNTTPYEWQTRGDDE